jgi:hypothetical protein
LTYGVYAILNASVILATQQMSVEIARLRRECDQLKANIRRQTGEDLASVNTDELDNLQKQLESALGKVRDRKVCTRSTWNSPLHVSVREKNGHVTVHHLFLCADVG